MNTAAAAIKAHVTVATIRTWCRRGVVTATKRAGRWIVDTASLAHRIAIGERRTRKEATTVTDYTALAAEARDLHARLTPAKNCHPADRIGGHRDRTSGAKKGRNAALSAAATYEQAAAGNVIDTALAADQLDLARRTAAKLSR